MDTQKKVMNNLAWRFLERVGAQGVTFIVSVILARILDPEVYGTIALVTVFIAIMQVFVDSGLGSALVQKNGADQIDFSTVFYFNLCICALLYLVMYFIAPLIADFYNKPELISVIRVSSLILIVSGAKNILQAYVSKNMLFKRFFFSTLGGTIGAAIVGIWLAYQGYGVWALVAQYLLNATVDTIILWLTVKWRPVKAFSLKRLKSLFRYGWKILASALLEVGYREARSLIIGKLYSSEDLAFYNRGQQFPNLIVENINSSIDSVLLPTLAAEQDDKNRVRDMTRRAIKTSSFLMMPLMVGLAVCAESVVRLVLTEKWLPAVFYLRIFCFTFAFYPIHTANLNAIKAMGRSDLFLKLEIAKKAIGIITLLIAMFISVKAIACSLIFCSVSNQLINSWPNQKLLGYSFVDQLKDMLPQIILSLVMGAFVYLISFVQTTDLIKLLIQIPSGCLIYVTGARMVKMDSYQYLINVIKSYSKAK